MKILQGKIALRRNRFTLFPDNPGIQIHLPLPVLQTEKTTLPEPSGQVQARGSHMSGAGPIAREQVAPEFRPDP